MKDMIKRIIISAVSGTLLGYLVFLFLQQKIIVADQFLSFNLMYYIILAVVCIYLFILFGVYPLYLKMTKATLFVVGIALILVGDTVLINNLDTGVFVGDIFKVLGVTLTLLAWTNVLITNKVKKQKEDSKIEIIEV